MSFLIDLTDDRFKTSVNRDVIDFIRRDNPFAHSGVADRLIASGKGLPGASDYCPAPANCAYVVLHTPSNRIFAIAWNMRGLAFRLGPKARDEALRDGGIAAEAIGPDWVSFQPWLLAERDEVTKARLARWCRRALDDAA
jgi:hypothetical protein